MEERRKSSRSKLEAKLILKRLDEEEGKEVNIEITDVSKTGVGFLCAETLVTGAVYEANLTIWTKEVLHVFLEIARIEKVGEVFSYGGTFVGMGEMDTARIAIYQMLEESIHKN